MGFFLILFVSIALGQCDIGDTAIAATFPLHTFCQARIPTSTYQPLYRALVCGTSLPPGPFQENLRQTGLLHIVVVSGSHLIWLEVLLRKLLGRSRIADAFIFISLLLFVGCAHCQAPVVRAGISLSAAALSQTLRLGWSAVQIALLSGFISLALFPDWISSASLLLSWTAALALASSPRGVGIWQTQARVYLYLFICLLPLAPSHPASIFFNVLAGPLLGTILFPASLVVCFFPPLTCLLDPVCTCLERGLAILVAGLPPMSNAIPIPQQWLWSYLLLLNLGLMIHEIHKGRRR